MWYYRGMQKDNNKKIIVVLSVLVGLIVVLLMAILIVTNIVNTYRSTTEIDYEEYEQKVASSTEDCEALKGLYSSGAVPREVAEETYDRMMTEAGDDNVYKVNLTLCYVQHIRYHGATFDEVLAILKAVEPYLPTDGDRIDYYDRLSVYYLEEDDWDNAVYYANLRDKLMHAEWPDEDDEDGDGEEGMYGYDDYDYYDDEYEEDEWGEE